MLGVGKQLVLAGIEAPTAARRLRTKSAAWLAVYLIAAVVVLGLVATVIVHNRHELVGLMMDYVFPTDWHFAGKLLIDRFFAAQEQVVITNAAIVASLMAVQITLFPIKEQVSAALEEDADLVGEPVEEHPMWFQAWEEVKLFLFMLAMQGTIFWIGYSQDPLRRKAAMVLSFAVLFASVAVDFLSPVMQRHKLRYSVMIKTYLAHPVLVFGFGALFALPVIIGTNIAADHPEWSFRTQLAVQFGSQIVGIVLAAIGGTVAGAPLIADARRRKRSHLVVRVLVWVTLIGLLAWNGYRFGAVGRSLHHKSQILKCDYDVDWSSFSADTPSALDLIGAARTDTLKVSASFEVGITNPTSIDLEIEDNRLEVLQQGQLVAVTSLPRVRVRAGTTEKVRVALPLTVKPSQALRIRELLTTKGWTMTLWLRVADGFDFPVYLLTDP